MTKYQHVLDLNSEYEARMLEEILHDNDIPHVIVAREGSAFGSIVQMEEGYGYVTAPEEFHARIAALYRELTNS